jgi:Polysaccharide biosynthesis protein
VIGRHAHGHTARYDAHQGHDERVSTPRAASDASHRDPPASSIRESGAIPSPVDAHEAPESLRGAAVRGLAWTMLRSVSSRVVGSIVFIVLARLLDPMAFGTVALASFFVVLISVLVESGFGEALIQRKEVTRSDLDTAFWVSNAIGVALALIMMGSAGAIGALFDQPELAPVLRVLSLVFVFAGLASVPQALLRRECLPRPGRHTRGRRCRCGDGIRRLWRMEPCRSDVEQRGRWNLGAVAGVLLATRPSSFSF